MQRRTQYLISFLLIAVVALSVAGCKKDGGGSSGISGKYRLVYNQNSDTLPQYFTFNDDKSYSGLMQDNQAAHSVDKGVYQIDGNSVILAAGSPRVYLEVKSGDTLKLLGSPLQPDSYFNNIILVKDASTPAVADWVQEVTINSTIPEIGINFSSFTILNSLFYTSDQYTNIISRYDVADGYQQAQLTTGEMYFGLENVSGNLWGISAGTNLLQQLNPLTGAVIFTAAAPPADMHVLASDGTHIYGWNINTSRMYTYTIAGDSYDAGRDFHADLRDLAYRSGFIYGSAYNYIYKIDPATLKVVKTFTVKGIKGVSGIAVNGPSTWIYVSDELNTPGYFAEITLD